MAATGDRRDRWLSLTLARPKNIGVGLWTIPVDTLSISAPTAPGDFIRPPVERSASLTETVTSTGSAAKRHIQRFSKRTTKDARDVGSVTRLERELAQRIEFAIRDRGRTGKRGQFAGVLPPTPTAPLASAQLHRWCSPGAATGARPRFRFRALSRHRHGSYRR